jgi:peptidyl-prolyl cis-trans isomerase A (cyclophilin A)
MKKSAVLFIMVFVLFIGCSGMSSIKEPGIYAVFDTNMGEFICKLEYQKAPITSANFIGLADGTREYTDPKTEKKVKKPYFNGLTFHRVIKDFVIQGGDPMGNGRGNPGYTFLDEVTDDLKFDTAGLLAMANSGPNTNGSQFFVTLSPTPQLDGMYSIFGKVVTGMENIVKINEVKVDPSYKPYKDVILKSLKIERIGEEAKKFDAEKVFATKDEAFKNLEKLNVEKSKVFLKKIGVTDTNVITTGSGLKYFVKKRGTGKMPKKGDWIVANYAGYLDTGREFDSSFKRNQPLEIQIGIGKVIEGWDEAILNMRIGERRILIIPYYLAYGERGNPPVIPAKATLIFDVELLNIK